MPCFAHPHPRCSRPHTVDPLGWQNWCSIFFRIFTVLDNSLDSAVYPRHLKRNSRCCLLVFGVRSAFIHRAVVSPSERLVFTPSSQYSAFFHAAVPLFCVLQADHLSDLLNDGTPVYVILPKDDPAVIAAERRAEAARAHAESGSNANENQQEDEQQQQQQDAPRTPDHGRTIAGGVGGSSFRAESPPPNIPPLTPHANSRGRTLARRGHELPREKLDEGGGAEMIEQEVAERGLADNGELTPIPPLLEGREENGGDDAPARFAPLSTVGGDDEDEDGTADSIGG